MKLFILLSCFVIYTKQYNILAIFAHNGRSHHIFFSALIEELTITHNVTVINYFPMKNVTNLRQICLKENDNEKNVVNIEERLSNSPGIFANFYKTRDSLKAFRSMANLNCEKLIKNERVRALFKNKYDLVIVEQFVTDCGLAIAFKLNAPVIGMTAHILMPWTYNRLGAPNHPAFVPNRFLGTDSKPDLWHRIQSLFINFYTNYYYSNYIQRRDQEIINEEFDNVPNLEDLGKNISLFLLNQYFPLTGSRLFGANVIEIGGLHIKETQVIDKELNFFMNNMTTDVVYISFGTVAAKFPLKLVNEIRKTVTKLKNVTFIWKTNDYSDWMVPENVFVREWFQQSAILCHPKVKAFVTHSGMLSTSEAIHCGTPTVCVPLFGDQFANAASTVEAGLGIALDIKHLDEFSLSDAILTVLDGTYQRQAKTLSDKWKDRPLSPMNTALFWIEYVAKHKYVQLQPPTVDLPFYKYIMFDLYLFIFIVIILFIYCLINFIYFLMYICSVFEIKNKID